MNAYRDQYAQLFHGGRGVTLLAISVDADTVLRNWATERGYPFRFVSDTSGAVGTAYGSHLDRFGGVDVRNVFVIAPDGRVAEAMVPFREVDPAAYRRLGAVIDSLTTPGR
jgi:peroxiredoxin